MNQESHRARKATSPEYGRGMLALFVPLVLAAQSGIVIGVGSRGSVIQVSDVGKPGSVSAKDATFVALTDVMSPRLLQKSGAEAMRFTLDAALGELVSIEPRAPSRANQCVPALEAP